MRNKEVKDIKISGITCRSPIPGARKCGRGMMGAEEERVAPTTTTTTSLRLILSPTDPMVLPHPYINSVGGGPTYMGMTGPHMTGL